MDPNEDDELMRRYLFLEKEMAELGKALQTKRATAASERGRHLKNEIVVLSSDDEVHLDQEVSESNQETAIKLKEAEKIDEVDETEEAGETGEADGEDGRDSIGTSESEDGGDGDDLAMSEDDPEAGRSRTGRRFRCQQPGCASAFKHKWNLTQHQNVHTNKFQCHVCQKCCKCRDDLQRHLPVHSEARPFACDWAGCGGTFKWKDQMERHRNAVHSNKRRFKCDKQGCGRLFKSKPALYHHLKYTHSPLRRFKCQAQGCGKRFKRRCNLTRHMNNVHYDVRKYRCHFKNCEKTFKNRQNLAQHLKIHK